MTTRVHWNFPSITSEMFDDEAVIVNFDSGKYHSLQGSGRLVWQWLQSPSTLDELVARSASNFSGDRHDIERAIREFVATLQQEGLIVPAPADVVPQPAIEEVAAPSPFTRPVLNTFSDMEELLLLDPIHEVDAAGWPIAKNTGGD